MRARLAGLGLLMTGALVFGFSVPDAQSFQEPSLARILFVHLPCALITTGLVVVCAWLGYRVLTKGPDRYDHRLQAATELAALFGALTMATGIVFSRVQWGSWWQWDPRQTSFLIVLLLLGAGLALRSGLAEEVRRARACAAYALATVIPGVFLIYVFPRLEQVRSESFHPSTTIAEGQLDSVYRAALYLSFAAMLWMSVELYRLRVRAAEIERQSENEDGLDETRGGGSAPDRVVRPVALPRGG